MDKVLQNHFYDFLLSMDFCNPAPLGSINKSQDIISLSLCNEIITNIVGAHIGISVNPHFFILLVEVSVSVTNEDTIYYKLTNEQAFIKTLQKYNYDVRNDIKNKKQPDLCDYYKQETDPSNPIFISSQILQTCNIFEQLHKIVLTFKLYQPIKDKDNQTIYRKVNFIYLEKEQKVAVHTYLKKVCQQSAYNLEHCRYHNLIKNVAVSAALSQVMARNLSHNIGSHGFSNLINNEIYEKLNEKISKNTYQPQKSKNGVCVNKQDENSQLAYFNQYLKSRFDYLSEVTFGVSNVLTTKRIYNDMFLEFDRVRLLLNHISGISDFQFEIKLQYNGNLLNETNDISVSFPSDVLGCQAFYNIIENIIRNTAKHDQNAKIGVKTFTINIKDIDNNQPDFPDDYQQYYCVEIDDGISITEIDKLVQKQNDRLNQSVLDDSENHKLRNNSLGLLEMEASAAFLRQIDMPEIEGKDYDIENNELYYNNKSCKLNIIKAFKTEKNALGYRFFIKKPQEFLFVGDWEISDEKKKSLMNKGIWFKTEDDLKKDLEKGIAFAHRFVISEKNENDFFTDNNLFDKKYEYKTLLPNRWVKIENDGKINSILNNEFDILDLEATIWEIYNRQNKIDIPKCTIITSLPQSGTIELIDKQIVLLDHLQQQEKEYQRFIAQKGGNISKKTWIEPLSSNAQKKLPFIFQHTLAQYRDKIKNDDNNCRFDKEETANVVKSLLWDCYSTAVLVVDERIQEYSETVYSGATQVKNKDVFANAGIIVTNNSLSTNKLSDKLIESINTEIDTLNPTFLLIHYGILERYYGNNADSIKNCLTDWTYNKGCKVVVTSGRGKHSLKLPECVRYLNLSSVLYAFVENQNKYSMNYILNQARR